MTDNALRDAIFKGYDDWRKSDQAAGPEDYIEVEVMAWMRSMGAVPDDDLDRFMREQAEKDPTFASSFLVRQGESLLRLWVEAWEHGGKYPVQATRIALGEQTQ